MRLARFVAPCSPRILCRERFADCVRSAWLVRNKNSDAVCRGIEGWKEWRRAAAPRPWERLVGSKDAPDGMIDAEV